MTSASATSLGDAPRARPRAVRRTGQETAARIVDAAYELLRTGGLSEFSMRGVAKRAGVRLAGAQYHFPTMSDLVRALIDLNTRRYQEAYERVVEGRGGTPRERLEAIIAFNLEDIQDRDTRRFFIHIWPLLEALDGFSGSLLTELYASQFALLSARIADLHPDLDPAEARRRAELIAALIEGMFITLPQSEGHRSDLLVIEVRAVRLCMAIADGAVR